LNESQGKLKNDRTRGQDDVYQGNSMWNRSETDFIGDKKSTLECLDCAGLMYGNKCGI